MKLSRWRPYAKLRKYHIHLFLVGCLLVMIIYIELRTDVSSVQHNIAAIETIDNYINGIDEVRDHVTRPNQAEVTQRESDPRNPQNIQRMAKSYDKALPVLGGNFNKNKAAIHHPTHSVCKDVTEDRPNWTIVFKKSTPDYCSRQKYFKWVKRIVFANKTAIYRGCTSRTHKCGYLPYFDNKLKARINAPPCCRRHVIEIFRNFAKRMEEYSGRYFLFGGGLIGWYRNRSVVPYDHDLDILVDLNFWRSSRFESMLRKLKREHGHFIKKKSWNKVKIYYSKLNHNFIDLWPFSRKGKDKIRINSSQWKIHNFTHVLPLKKSSFEGIKIWTPHDPEAMLTAEYGKSWRTELTCKKVGKFGNCLK